MRMRRSSRLDVISECVVVVKLKEERRCGTNDCGMSACI